MGSYSFRLHAFAGTLHFYIRWSCSFWLLTFAVVLLTSVSAYNVSLLVSTVVSWLIFAFVRPVRAGVREELVDRLVNVGA